MVVQLACLMMALADLADERYADGGDDEGGGDAEDDVLPEGEVVGVPRRPPRLLAHDQVRRRPQQRQVPRHRAHPRQQQPRPRHRRRRYQRRRLRHLITHKKHCMVGEEEDDDGEDGDAADAVDLGVGRHEVPDGSREPRLVEAAHRDEHAGEEDQQRVGHGVKARLGVAEVDDHEGQRRGDGRPRHVEPHHVRHHHAHRHHVREALEEQLPPLLRALHEPRVLRRYVLRHLQRQHRPVAVQLRALHRRRRPPLLHGLHLLAVDAEFGASPQLPPVHAEQHDHVDGHAGEHGREDAKEELWEGDLAVEGDDQVLRVADGGGGGADVGAGGERQEEGLGGEVALGGELQDELGEDDAAGVVCEEGAGERGDDADAAHEVTPPLALPGEQPPQVLEHAGVLEVAADDHGGEEEAEDWEVDGGVGVVGADHVEDHHQHRAQQRPRRPADGKERHRREHRHHPEHRERDRSQRHLGRRRQLTHLLRPTT